MAKVVRSRSTHQLEEIDSQAPTLGIDETITEDGILCSILSSLTLIEAVRTSVLSPRWRHIWTRLTKFNLDAITMLGAHNLKDLPPDGEEAYELTVGKTNKFIRSVNSVLKQLQGARVDELGISFFLHKIHSHHIDSWVRFAVVSNIKRFGLILFRPSMSSWMEPYDFPCELLGSSPSMESLALSFCCLKLPTKFDGLTHLAKLALGDVNVTQEDFNRILSKCSSTLAHMFVSTIRQWESISIPHPLNQLQSFTVQDCTQARIIEINAENLVKLDYHGAPVDFRLTQCKKLTDARIRLNTERSVRNLSSYVTELSSSLPHLQSLTLKLSGISKAVKLPKGSSCFFHLKRLDWKWNDNFKMSLLHLATVLDATPFIEEFKLRLSPRFTRFLDQPPQTPTKFMEMQPRPPLTRLKIIQISGFYFDRWQIEIAVYLFRIATKLRLVMIEKGDKTPWSVSEDINEMGKRILNQEAPAYIKLVFL